MFADDLKQIISDNQDKTALNLLDKPTFIRNLVLLYHIINASENLLEVAIRESMGDPLHLYFRDHLEEERAHEQWLREDIASEGIDAAKTFINRQAVEIVGSQYYFLYHVDVAALLGYMAVLEFFPLSAGIIDELEEEHGTALLRTLKYHSIHDIEHGADLVDVLNALSADRQYIVLQSAIQTVFYLNSAIADIR
jgi:hypothetical protein